MSLAFTQKVGGATRAVTLAKGVKVAELTCTVGAQTDYVSGFDLQGLAAQLGFKRIWYADGTICQANGTIRAFFPLWHRQSGKLRFFEQNAGAGPFDEMDQADIAANDVIDLFVVGI